MISVQNNAGYRGLYVIASFRPMDTSPYAIAAAYSGAIVSDAGLEVTDSGWLPPTGSSDGPIREVLRWSLRRSSPGEDSSGNEVGQGDIAMYTSIIGSNGLQHSEVGDYIAGFPGQRYFTLLGLGRCIRLRMEIYTPLNMIDRRTSPKTRRVKRYFSEGWPVSDLRLIYGDQNFSGGAPWFLASDRYDNNFFALDEAAVAAGTAAPFPTHTKEDIDGELLF